MSESNFLDDETIQALEILKAKGVIPESFNPDEEILQNFNKVDSY